MKKTNLLLLIASCGFLAYGFIASVPQDEAEKLKSEPSQQTQTGINVGDIAPDISYNNPEGRPVSLSSLRGKMVLLDFWASWCRPCRMENPNLVSSYKKYKNSKFAEGKGFTILGVSLDMNKDAWIKAIGVDSLTWDQISDLGYWNSEPAKLYGVRSIPSNFLIDGKGKIIAVNLRGPALNDELEKAKRANTSPAPTPNSQSGKVPKN